jgi:hypothetical protein
VTSSLARKRRDPEPDLAERQRRLADKLAAVTQVAHELQASEDQLHAARQRLRDALREAHTEGASFTMLGQLLGLSRQRIAQMLGEKN